MQTPTEPAAAAHSRHPVPPGLEDDPEGARIVGEELKLLSTVQSALDMADRSQDSATRGRALDDERLLELRDHVAAAKPEDLPALFEQMHHLGALRAQRGRGARGWVDRASPYFGHMRLEEQVDGGDDGVRRGAKKGPARRRDVLIGSRSYVDSGEGIRIVDWRQAPVSRLYYRYSEGDDYEEELGNRLVEGAVVVRRGVSIVRGELAAVTAPQGTFVRSKDGAWRRANVARARLETERKRLGVGVDGHVRTDKHLPAIAAMLDERQFDLIARDSKGLVAVQGSAGSGKTTVGLHRVAYLAFQEPQRFRPDKMFVVVPNEALVHYVSRVLPSLGVDGVPATTFPRFASRLTAQLFPKLPAKTSDETPAVVARAKSHAAMLQAIDWAVARAVADVDAKLRAAMAKWPQGEAVVSAWQRTDEGRGARADGRARGPSSESERPKVPDSAKAPLDVRVSLLGQWLEGKRALGDATASALPPVTRSAAEKAVADARRQSRSAQGIWDEILTSRQALGEAFAHVTTPGLSPPQLDQVHAWCVRQARVRAEGERDGEEPTLDAEDFALLLRSWQALRGPLVGPDAKPIRFAHIFVDEVQDASPIDLRVLLELTGAERCITLAGDVAQRLLDEGDDRGELDWNALLDDLGMAHTKIEPLRVSYRSTAEVTDFARAVLGPLAHADVPETTRRGPPVELFQHTSTGETVAWLAEALKQLAVDEPEANVALIARFPQQADVYYEGLLRAEVPNVRRIAKQDFSWEAGVDVTDVRQTKGLEFDEVVLLETTAATYPVTPPARHALYVGATRATHQLWCVASESASELVIGALGSSNA